MKILVTGSSGLIGGEVVEYFAQLGHTVIGVDNNMRADFFGIAGDTLWNQRRLSSKHSKFEHLDLDVRDRSRMLDLIGTVQPEAIVHAAAQPSHDLAASRPFDDFEVNALGTLNVLEAARRSVPDSPFIYMSTNKVYGDAPNEIKLEELPTRWDYCDPSYSCGIPESFRIDQSKHSLFGASKVAADIMVQEYGRYFGMPTCCLRGGCLTGRNHSGVELHGFLSYLVKANMEETIYKIYGHKGKQVRDNIHAYDVARFIHAFIESPRYGEVYNLGGGRDNSCSIMEAFEAVEQLTGIKMRYEYLDNARNGDHVCYISDLRKICAHYPGWSISVNLSSILEDVVAGWRSRLTP